MTPLIPSSMPEEAVKNFGKQVPLKRAGQPAELATAYVCSQILFRAIPPGRRWPSLVANRSSDGRAKSRNTGWPIVGYRPK